MIKNRLVFKNQDTLDKIKEYNDVQFIPRVDERVIIDNIMYNVIKIAYHYDTFYNHTITVISVTLRELKY